MRYKNVQNLSLRNALCETATAIATICAYKLQSNGDCNKVSGSGTGSVLKYVTIDS